MNWTLLAGILGGMLAGYVIGWYRAKRSLTANADTVAAWQKTKE